MSDSPVPSEIGLIKELTERGRVHDAEKVCQQLVRDAPGEHHGWAWLGMLTMVLGRTNEAEAALRQAIALFPSDARYWTNLSTALRAQGKLAESEACARRATEVDPSNAAHWAGWAVVLAQRHQWSEAASAYREVVAREPGNSAAWSELAAAEQQLGRSDAAQEAFEHARSLSPDDVVIAAKYACVLVQRGDRQRGVELLQDLSKKAPDVPAVWLALGSSHRFLGNKEQAESALRKAMDLDPDNEDVQREMAQLLPLNEALSLIRKLLAKNPQDAEAWKLMGRIRFVQARPDDAVFAFQRSLALSPNHVTHGLLISARQYSDKTTPDKLLESHRDWDATYARQLLTAPPVTVRRKNSDEPLRLGFVSSDFRTSSPSFLALNAFECLARENVSLIYYYDGAQHDEYTTRFKATASIWRTTAGLSDEELAEQIRTDKIDVLFDLMGHVGVRLLVFARKPAPMQITWLGYVGTTGLSAMDYLLADRLHVRQGEERWYAERILRMPHDYVCYSPPLNTPDVKALPALSRGQITFGCFNNPVKYSLGLLKAWSEILRKVPNSRLALKYFSLVDKELQNWLNEQFAQLGVRSEQVFVDGPSLHGELLESYDQVDVALDTFPYSGGVTTCEALWMGVPVITFPGETFAGRHSTSHMTNAGYPQFVGKGLDDYIQLAEKWANRIDELSAIRTTMREQVHQSPLCDADKFARDFLEVIERAWKAKVAER